MVFMLISAKKWLHTNFRWSVDLNMWSADLDLWSVHLDMWSVHLDMWSVHLNMLSVQLKRSVYTFSYSSIFFFVWVWKLYCGIIDFHRYQFSLEFQGYFNLWFCTSWHIYTYRKFVYRFKFLLNIHKYWFISNNNEFTVYRVVGYVYSPLPLVYLLWYFSSQDN